jgi:thioredoxin reductase (NADPH)
MQTLDLLVVGAGPAGISMAAEARAAGIASDKILIIEKSAEHSWAIRKFYPEQKLVTANYKGNAAVCQGVMCIPDSSKVDTLTYLDRAIEENQIAVSYGESVYKMTKKEDGMFEVVTDKKTYLAKICAIAIGIMGKPNKPDYSVASELLSRVHYDITSKPIRNASVLVVGGGDSASEYAQYLVQEGNRVSLSYRQAEFNRMNDINRESLLALEARGEVNILRQSNVQGLESDGEQVRVNFKEDNFAAQSFDHVVLALGGTTPKNFLTLLGIEFNGESPILKDGQETSVSGLFLIGDLAAGRRGGSIISAFNSSREAMRKICTDYLSCSLE